MTTEGIDPNLEWLLQSDWREILIPSLGQDLWVTVYSHESNKNEIYNVFSALIPITYVQTSLSNNSWDLHVQSGRPGCIKSCDEDEDVVKYLRFGNLEGIDFIVGLDENGNSIKYSCNPDGLANNFGKNPDSPNYLTPIFFRREVLTKYYAHSERYSVEDGYLRCQGIWGLQLDNNHNDYIIVFLGDLGRDLPSEEQMYWRSQNIPPEGKIR